MFRLITLIFVSLALFGQSQVVNNPSQGPPVDNFVRNLYYDGSGNLQYVCIAQATTSPSSVSVSGGTLTSIVTSTNTATATTVSAHNLYPGALVTVSGSTTAALNATYAILTVPTSTTYTFTTAGVPDATYNNSPLTITTRQPLLTDTSWAILVLVYSGTNLTGVHYGNQSTQRVLACSNRALY